MEEFSHRSDSGLFVQKFTEKNDGLLALVQPLISKIAHLCKDNGLSSSFSDISQQYLEAFVENVPASVIFLDTDFRIVHLSPHSILWIKKHLQKRLDKIPGQDPKGFSLIKLLSPLPHRLKLALNASLKGRSSKFDLEYAIDHKKARFVHWESFPWYGKNSQISGIMILCKDITRQQEIFLANKRLHQCNEMLENFSLIFSHDLIQPTRQAANFLSILEDSLIDRHQTDDSIIHALKAIKKSLNQVRTISEGVALYCRNGDLTTNSESVCLSSLIEEVRESCLDDSGFEINLLIDKKVFLQANRVTLLQLFQNLLTNAVKHDNSSSPVITISGEKKDNFYDISVHNNGFFRSKIKPSKIFDAFESSGVDGAGLGLMICKKIVTAYKGKISIKSSVAKGTIVLFSLPLVAS